jgi:hypothetical protein
MSPFHQFCESETIGPLDPNREKSKWRQEMKTVKKNYVFLILYVRSLRSFFWYFEVLHVFNFIYGIFSFWSYNPGSGSEFSKNLGLGSLHPLI